MLSDKKASPNKLHIESIKVERAVTRHRFGYLTRDSSITTASFFDAITQVSRETIEKVMVHCNPTW
jgi:hypothetical protein